MAFCRIRNRISYMLGSFVQIDYDIFTLQCMVCVLQLDERV